jgi:ketosteroid isomerase-like protein
MGTYNEKNLLYKVMQTTELLRKLTTVYESFSKNTIHELRELYRDDVTFVDPLHQIHGWTNLERYFLATTANLSLCRFEFSHCYPSGDAAFLQWQMHYAHPKLAKNKVLCLRGASLIRFEEQIYHHEDFYDLGEMLYEHIPLLRLGVRKVKALINGG